MHLSGTLECTDGRAILWLPYRAGPKARTREVKIDAPGWAVVGYTPVWSTYPPRTGPWVALIMPKATLEQKQNIVRWYCTRCSPRLRATIGLA